MSIQDIVSPAPSSPPTGRAHRVSMTGQEFNGVSPMNLGLPMYAKLTPRTKLITSLYAHMIIPGNSHEDIVEVMVRLKMSTLSLERLPEGVALPLREAIARCQEQPSTTWGANALELVGRRDIEMLVAPEKGQRDVVKWAIVSHTNPCSRTYTD